MAPPAPKNTIASPSSVHKLEAAIFHTMAFTLSLEIYNDKITSSTKRSFLKVFNNVCKVKKKPINFEEVSRIKETVRKIAICETTSFAVFILNSAFTSKENYSRVTIDEACDAFNAVMIDIGYTKK